MTNGKVLAPIQNRRVIGAHFLVLAIFVMLIPHITPKKAWTPTTPLEDAVDEARFWIELVLRISKVQSTVLAEIAA
jgi:hypothetical protein